MKRVKQLLKLSKNHTGNIQATSRSKSQVEDDRFCMQCPLLDVNAKWSQHFCSLAWVLLTSLPCPEVLQSGRPSELDEDDGASQTGTAWFPGSDTLEGPSEYTYK